MMRQIKKTSEIDSDLLHETLNLERTHSKSVKVRCNMLQAMTQLPY